MQYRQPGIDKLLHLVMQPDELFLVAFFQQPQPRALAFYPVVLALEPCHGAHTGKRVGHDGDGHPVAQTLDIVTTKGEFPLSPAMLQAHIVTIIFP